MSSPQVHLICNAHLDPIWQWSWEEGLTEALATFEVAADLLDEYPEFVFNHNESLLYEMVRDYHPPLFERIRQHVQSGRWVIAGGWYLQPDCNLPVSESFVRQALVGLAFFEREFGVRPRVAYNLDSFGHHGNMPQILKGFGYETYVHFRPTPEELNVKEAFLYRWRGVDGSTINALRPPCGWYNTGSSQELRDKIAAMTELARDCGHDVTLFWGAGDHGGGATREDLRVLREATRKGAPLVHASLEEYPRTVEHKWTQSPVLEGDLQKCFVGCYTSAIELKIANRRGEGLVQAAERAAALAWWLLDIPYPRQDLDRVWKGVLHNQFHDILPGSSVRKGVADAHELYGETFTLARRILLASHLALLAHETKRDAMPLWLVNPHPVRKRCVIEVEFMGATTPQLLEGKTFMVRNRAGEVVPHQMLGPRHALAPQRDFWRQRLCIDADMPAMGVGEYRIEVVEREVPAPEAGISVERSQGVLTLRSAHARVQFNTRTGLMNWLGLPGSRKNYMSTPGGEIIVREDSANSWGMGADAYGAEVGRFRCPSKEDAASLLGYKTCKTASPVRVIEQGPLCTTVEVLQVYNRSLARLRYRFYTNTSRIDVEMLLNWEERRRCAQWHWPTTCDASEYEAEIPFGRIVRSVGGGEEPVGRWVMCSSQRRAVAFGIAGNGPGGVDVDRGTLHLSLVRSPMFCTMLQEPRHDLAPEYMDLGEHIYRFSICFGERDEVRRALVEAADDLQMPPAAHVHVPLGARKPAGLEPDRDTVRVDGDGVRLAALKQSEDGKALVVRVYESEGRETKGAIHILGASAKRFSLGPCQVRTFLLERESAGPVWSECNLREEPLE